MQIGKKLRVRFIVTITIHHTNFTEQGSSSQVDSRSVDQEFPSILLNPKMHYPVINSLPLDPTLRHLKQVHTLQHHLFKTHFNIIHLSMPVPSYLFPSLFPIKMLCSFLISTGQHLLELITLIIQDEE